jgi:hypothetical protein
MDRVMSDRATIWSSSLACPGRITDSTEIRMPIRRQSTQNHARDRASHSTEALHKLASRLGEVQDRPADEHEVHKPEPEPELNASGSYRSRLPFTYFL